MPTIISRFAARAGAWLIASTIAYLCASVLHSQTVLAGLSALQVPITLGERLSMTLGDLVGLNAYALVIALGLAIALPVLSLSPIRRRIASPMLRGAIAGVLAMAVMLILMRQVFGFSPIASARGAVGLLLQCAAGGAGGAVYGLMRRAVRSR